MPFPTFTLPLFRKYNRLDSSDDPEHSSMEKETFYLHHEDQTQAIISTPTPTPISQLKNIYIKVSSIRSARVEGNVTPWIFSTFVFALLATVLLFNGGNGNGGRWTGGTERERTDRILGIPKTPIVPVQFSGSPSFDSNGVESMVPESPPYTGYPSPEIDEAWEVLNGGRYFAITEKEAKELWGKGYMEFADKVHGGFTTGLDVFHSLHCLNSIRVALYPDSYPPPDHTHGPEHLDHCLIHLRQHIQCSGDTTPNPTKFYQGINSNYVYGDRIHSCRDWSVIRKWAWERHNGTLKVEREGLKKL